MPDDAHVLDLLPAFSIGGLDPDEAGHVETHLLSCVICRNESNTYQLVSAQLGLAVPVRVSSPNLKAQLMKRVRATIVKSKNPERQPATRSWYERLLPTWGFASLVLILVLGAINLLLWQRFNERDIFLAPGGMRAVPLIPPDSASVATGFVLISVDGDSGALVVDGLPPLGENQQYQLWLIRNGERTSGAVFSTDEHSYGGTRIRAPLSLLEYSAVGITIEPAGGSPQPTGKQVLAGTLRTP